MCGRYRIKDPGKIREIIALVTDGKHTLAEVASRYNIHPDDFQFLIHGSAEGPKVETARWGLVPFWEKAPRSKIAPINARSGEAFSKPMFRQAVQKRRCLLASDGFYEWPKQELGAVSRIPAFYGLQGERPYFFAGIYEDAVEGIRPPTYSIFTTTPNSLLLRLPHERMPVILDTDRAKEWINPGSISEAAFLDFCRPYPEEKMVSWPVSTYVNKPQNQGPECSEPVTIPKTPPLAKKPDQVTFDF